MAFHYGGVASEGTQLAEAADAAEAWSRWDEGRGGTLVMVLEDPSEAEIRDAARAMSLHELAVEDTLKGHQRPKLEKYGDTLFVVLHPVRYTDRTEKLQVTETHLFVGPASFLVVTSQRRDAQRAEQQIRKAFRRPHLEPHNPQCLLYFVLDRIVDEYEPILVDLDEDLDGIEEQLFTGENSSQRIYELFNEVVTFQRATRPLSYMVDLLMRGAEKYGMPEALLPHFRDVRDHAIRAMDHLDGLRAALQNALTVEATMVGQAQNDAMKKMSAWAAILIAPTIIVGLYGMNFEHMPELTWEYGYLYAVGLMVAVCTVLWAVFKRKDWL